VLLFLGTLVAGYVLWNLGNILPALPAGAAVVLRVPVPLMLMSALLVVANGGLRLATRLVDWQAGRVGIRGTHG
jgi:hypothetical protein